MEALVIDPSEVARLKGPQQTAQLNIWIDKELKRRIERLKTEKRIDTSHEIRKIVSLLVDQLEALP